MTILALGSDRQVFVPGSASATRQLAYAKALGDVHIIVFTRRSEPFVAKALADSVHVYPTRSLSKLTYWWGALRLGLRLPKPDVVSVQDPFEAGLIGLWIATLRRVPLHVQVHTDLFSPAFVRHSFLNRIRLSIARSVLMNAARIRVVSDRIRVSVQEELPLKAPITVLPIFTDVEKFKHVQSGELLQRFSKNSPRILVVSRLEPEKNVRLAIESYLKGAPVSACLIIVGEGSQRHELESYAIRNGSSLHISFEGYQDPGPYYALADLVLVPSHYEGYGNVIIEALAAGKPVIATDVGIAREAGAIIATEETFTDAVRLWCTSGEKVGVLKYAPYHNFDEYVAQYARDLQAVVPKKAEEAETPKS